MSHRAHLFSLRICHALRESLAEGYNRHKLVKDLLAGVTVGIIAIPLAMALAIAAAEGFELHAISFDYGQRHRFELEAAAQVCKAQRASQALMLGRSQALGAARP